MMLFLLEKISSQLIRKYCPVVVCITGSIGKTSTKDAIAASLSTSFRIRKTPKNLNNEYGVPISIIGVFRSKEGFWALVSICFSGLRQLFLGRYFPEILIIEVGVGKIGEVKRVASWLKPDLLVITNLPDKPSHLGIFGSRNNILEEKKFLANAMDIRGKLFIDSSLGNMDSFAEPFKGKVITYDGNNLVLLSDYALTYEENDEMLMPTGFTMNSLLGDEKYPRMKFRGFIGVQNVRAIITAQLVAKELGCKASNIVRGLKGYIPTPGRLRLINGRVKNVTIIDDSFNSSPIAVENSLRTFLTIKKTDAQRTIAVLGDMLNLGTESVAVHEATVTKEVSKVDILITVGNISRVWQTYNSNRSGLNNHFKNALNAAAYIKTIEKPGDLILFKGGHLIRLEKAVKVLGRCDKEDLVRQEEYWQRPEFELYNIEADAK